MTPQDVIHTERGPVRDLDEVGVKRELLADGTVREYFSVYRDDAGPTQRPGPRIFAVADAPGPDTPKGALDAAQSLVDARTNDGEDTLGLENGGCHEPYGCIEYDETGLTAVRVTHQD